MESLMGEEILKKQRQRCMRTRKVQWWEEGIKKSVWKELAMDRMVVTITIPCKRGVKAAKDMKENGMMERGRGQTMSVMSRGGGDIGSTSENEFW